MLLRAHSDEEIRRFASMSKSIPHVSSGDACGICQSERIAMLQINSGNPPMETDRLYLISMLDFTRSSLSLMDVPMPAEINTAANSTPWKTPV